MAEVKITITAEDGTKKTFNAVEEGAKSAFNKVSAAGEGSASKIKAAWDNLKSHWVEITAGIGAAWAATNFLRGAMQESLNAEVAFNKLKIQVEGLGVAYDSVSGTIDAAIKKTAEYARVQDEDVAKSLQGMIFLTGDLAGSMKNLNLVYDLAYQKGISQEEAASLVGKAMTGNVEMLGRYIPELRNLEKALGDNATAVQKSAYAMQLLEEKSAEALSKMTEHEKKLKDATKAWADFYEKIGEFSIIIASTVVDGLKDLQRTVEQGGPQIRQLAKDHEAAAEAANKDAEAHHKTAAAIAASAKAVNDTVTILTAYATGLKAVHAGILKLAGENFTAAFEQQKGSIVGIKTAMTGYLAVIEQVYTREISGLKALEAAKKAAGHDAASIKKDSLAIVAAEQAQASALLSVWTNYYSSLKAQDEAYKRSKLTGESLLAAINDQLNTNALNAEQKYYYALDGLERDYRAAMEKTGQEKLDALTQYMTKASEVSNSVSKDGAGEVTQTEALERGYDQIRAALNEIAEEHKVIGTEMEEAAGKMDEYKAQIADLANKMNSLEMIVDDSKAKQAIANVKSALDAIPDITYKSIVMQVAGSTGALPNEPTSGTDYYGPGFASGTSYVPKTGLYQLHQGEKVLNRSEVSNNKRSTVVHINMPAITVQSSGNENPEAMAERLVRPLRRKLQELAFVS